MRGLTAKFLCRFVKALSVAIFFLGIFCYILSTTSSSCENRHIECTSAIKKMAFMKIHKTASSTIQNIIFRSIHNIIYFSGSFLVNVMLLILKQTRRSRESERCPASRGLLSIESRAISSKHLGRRTVEWTARDERFCASH